MKNLKPLHDILGRDDNKKEIYSSDQRKRSRRAQKGYYTQSKGLFSFIHLIKEWEQIVGKMMAQNTIPLKIKSHTLFISTKHSIFAQELGFLIPVIIEKIQERFPDLVGKITKIKFLHSNYSSNQFFQEKKSLNNKKESKPSMHPFSPEFMAKKSKAEKLFNEIEDPEIKKMLTDFMLT